MGRHGVPDGEPDPTPDLPPAGRRRAPDAEQADPPAWPDDDELTTLGRRTRAERRRDGLLPRSEDPTAGRGPGTPTGGQPDPGARPPAQAGPRTYVTGIPAVGPRDTAPPVGRGPTAPPPPLRPAGPPTVQQPGAAPATPPADRGDDRAPSPQGLPTPPPPAREQAPPATRGLPTPPPPVGPGTDGGPRTGGPSTTVDPLPGNRPPAGRAGEPPTPAPDRAPGTTGLPSWAATPGPPTPNPGPTSGPGPAAPRSGRGTPPPPLPTYDGPERRVAGRNGAVPAEGDRRAAPPLPVYDGPERRVADRPEAIPAEGDRRGARTHSIPERPPLAGSARPAAPAAAAGPGTGPQARRTEPGSGETGVIGGRAASRAERQAVDAALRREERRQGISTIPPLPEEGRRGSRGLVAALVAVVVVALVLLGFWAYQRPGADESAASTPTSASSAPATSTSAQPTTAAPTTAAPAGPVYAPVTVLNATDVDGLAGDIGGVLSAGGWEVRGESTYPEQDVAVTTVFYTAGDATQQAAAATLQEQFPDIVGGPSERFFDVDGEPDPGLVVVATGSWQP
ncbi:LytR C-terminal domain-containing protein [Klenkia taihuensis]|uniref:LytR cell envelope-related transcriptional attenuator n=1 Tax=Klenkia taihuensis TaxID=1225127 RepID=A0A1I1N1N2_9ACTN|nr:LytR C-terminal domain-containing protein [Klenkia taihuensis]GHE12313.1 hypothetical protein GCM10011381_29660 [Klenkia taihuensis]SFC91246.1 LytR cell envelope-related transcriptional attenuator [Klenkia taihuensis]